MDVLTMMFLDIWYLCNCRSKTLSSPPLAFQITILPPGNDRIRKMLKPHVIRQAGRIVYKFLSYPSLVT